jgi:Siphovirus Gp157
MLGTLDQITNEYAIAMRELEQWMMENPEAEGEIPEEFEERLNINRDEVEEKLGNYYNFIQELDSKQELLNDEIARLTARRKRFEATSSYLKAKVKLAVEQYGTINAKSKSKNPGKKLTTTLVNVSLVNSSSIKATNIDIVPDEYKSATVELKKLSNAKYLMLVRALSTYDPPMDQYQPYRELMDSIEPVFSLERTKLPEDISSIPGIQEVPNSHIRFS